MSSEMGVACALAPGAPVVMRDPEALFELGLMYSAGREVEADLVAAHKWFNVAAMRGCQEARRYRAEIAGEMSKSQLAEALRQAREWMARH